MNIFGQDNVIDASMCFGKDARRLTENCVWRIKHDILSSEQVKMSSLQDLDRGEWLLEIVKRRAPSVRRQLPKWMLVAHGGEGPEAA